MWSIYMFCVIWLFPKSPASSLATSVHPFWVIKNTRLCFSTPRALLHFKPLDLCFLEWFAFLLLHLLNRTCSPKWMQRLSYMKWPSFRAPTNWETLALKSYGVLCISQMFSRFYYEFLSFHPSPPLHSTICENGSHECFPLWIPSTCQSEWIFSKIAVT